MKTLGENENKISFDFEEVIGELNLDEVFIFIIFLFYDNKMFRIL
jgi:hypothetical protein